MRSRVGWTSLFLARTVSAAAASLLLLTAPSPAAPQSLLERPPNLAGTWVGESGTLHFHFLHRFDAGDEPTRNVTNTPTFLLSASLPQRTMVGARYATNSLVRVGFPNEWEFFGRWLPLSQAGGAPLDASLHLAWNQAAESVDGEVTLARDFGRVRVLGLGRVLGNAFHRDETRYALGGGAAIRLHEWVALTGDVVQLTDASDAERYAWSGGLALRIPYTPHTLNLQVSNANTTTLHGSVRQAFENRWGFEFTVPFTPSRYFGGGGAAAEGDTEAGAAVAAEVTMTNRLTFEPATIRIRAGQTVRWRNTSDIVHTVTADPSMAQSAESVRLPDGARPFDSGNLAPGAAFTYTFETAGEYRYFCLPHELAGMIGTVIVEP